MQKLDQEELKGWYKHPKFPLLYKNGRVWAVWAVGGSMFRTDGLVTGKIKEPGEYKVAANTLHSAPEQAVLESERKWIEQVTKGYAPDPADHTGTAIYNHVTSQLAANGGLKRGCRMFEATQITASTTAGAKDLASVKNPMLAQKYMDFDKEGDLVITNAGAAIKWPALVQPKLDGVRTLASLKNGKVILESRSGKDYVHLDHIRAAIKDFLSLSKVPIVLDGEMYIHELYRDADGNPTLDSDERELKSVERFQFISEACKVTRSKAHPFEGLIQFWIFDIWEGTTTGGSSSACGRTESEIRNTAMDRWDLLESLFEKFYQKYPDQKVIQLVPTYIANGPEDVDRYMSEFVGEDDNRVGYAFEGLMIRQANGFYNDKKGYHSKELLKLKRFMDDEWTIVGAESCEGTQQGAIKWIVSKKIGGKTQTLTAKQMGDVTASRKMLTDFNKNPKKFIGKSINIRYNETTADGIPRFPRATAIVEDK